MTAFKREGLCATIFLVLFLSACTTLESKRGVNRPIWIDTPPSNGLAASASASYEIFGETKARENAVMKALSIIALQKASTVDIEGKVDHVSQFSSQGDTESFRENASISVKTTIGGSEIPVKANIKAFWKDKIGKRIWVLIAEE